MPSNSTTSLLSDKRIEHAVLAIGSIGVAVVLLKTTLALIKNKVTIWPTAKFSHSKTNCQYTQNGNNLPMVPYKYPFIGSTFEFYSNPLKLAKLYTEKWGSTFRMHLHGDVVTVVGAKDASEVFNHSQLSFLASRNISEKRILYAYFAI